MANLKTPTPAKKLLNPKEDPPTASSSDEEVKTSSGEEEEQIAVSAAAKEDAGSDSGSDSDSDSESEPPEEAGTVSTVKSKSSEGNEPKISSIKTLKPPSAVSAAAKEDSGSDSGSETDSGSEPEPPEKAVSVTVTPLKSKKKEVNASPAVKSVKKRGNEGTSTTEGNAKRAKNVSGDEEEKKSGEENKKPPFQRLWSEEDEITLLQGMIDFKAETGTSPLDDMNGFYDKVKKFISFDVSKSQFGDKIRGLKKNYFAGKKKSLESSHDKKCLGLVKFIWGGDGMGPESSLKSNKKVEKNKEVKGSVEEDDEVVILGGDKESSSWFERSYLVRSIESLGVDECSVKEKWSQVPMETKKRMEEKFKVVNAMKYEMLVLKADLLKEVTSVIFEG